MAATRAKSLGGFLLNRGFITAEQLDGAVEEQKRSRISLRESLLKLGFAREEEMLTFYEEELGIP